MILLQYVKEYFFLTWLFSWAVDTVEQTMIAWASKPFLLRWKRNAVIFVLPKTYSNWNWIPRWPSFISISLFKNTKCVIFLSTTIYDTIDSNPRMLLSRKCLIKYRRYASSISQKENRQEQPVFKHVLLCWLRS